MTDDMMNLRALVEKAPDADLLREMIGFAAQRLMELEVAGLTGAAYGEKNTERAQRNGSRERTWENACRRGRATHSQAAQRKLLLGLPGAAPDGREGTDRLIQEAYVQGVSTRSVDDLVQAMRMTGISKSQVSRLCSEIDEKVKAFLARPIEGDWSICGSMLREGAPEWASSRWP